MNGITARIDDLERRAKDAPTLAEGQRLAEEADQLRRSGARSRWTLPQGAPLLRN